ncbi:MAG TPA: hypothetical protein VH833_00265 [Gemmatimonadales bacterium]|jgi:hypothetical protein
MKPRISGLYGIVALLAGTALACHNDPTAEGVGSPFAVVLDFSSLTLDQGSSAQVVARIVDSRFTPLEGDITFASCDAATATVTADPTFNPVPPLAERATIAAVGANASCITASAAGAKPDTVQLIVLPTSFAGALSTNSAIPGSTLTISSTSSLKFDPATSTVIFAGGAVPPILSATVDQIQVLVPFGDPGPITITNIAVTYVPGLVVTLATSGSFTPTGDPFPGNNEWQTAPDITSLIPATVGVSPVFVATGTAGNPPLTCAEDRFGFGPSGNCSIFKFTLAAPTTISFEVNWDGGSGDVDAVICSDSALASFDVTFTTFDPCAGDGLGGAGASQPEVAGGVLYPAGTYWLVTQDFDGGGALNYYIKIEVQ